MQDSTLDCSVFIEPHLEGHYFYREEEKVGGKKKEPLNPAESLDVLVKNTGLCYLRIYGSQKNIYLYLSKYNCYFQITDLDLSIIISRIFFRLKLPPRFRLNSYLESVTKSCVYHPHISYLSNPQEDINHHLISFQNGILDINTQALNKDLCPELFIVHHRPYDYDPDMPTPCFDAYLEDISNGVEDRKRFLMAVLNVVVRGEQDLQIFVHLVGPAGVGKSKYTALAQALVGDDTTHATTLSAIQSDQFQIVNIEDKKLILIGDAENYTRDTSQLKALTGGDPLRGRTMFINPTREVYLSGTVILTSNHFLNIRDSSGAIMRRIRVYVITTVPRVKKNLISKDKRGHWIGELVPELPGIFHRVVSVPPEDVDHYIRNFYQVEALREGLEETADLLNPLRLYVQEALQVGEGAFLGLKPKGEREIRDFASRRMLYSTYLDFQYRRGLTQPVSHNTFTTLLISACKDLGMTVAKVRKPSGTYVEGIIVKPNYYNPDIAAGGPLDPVDLNTEPPTIKNHYPTLNPVVTRDIPSSSSLNSIPLDQDIEPQTSLTPCTTSIPVVQGTVNSSSNNDSSLSNTLHTVSRLKASPSVISHQGEPKELNKPLNKINSEARQKRYFTTSEPQYVDPSLSSCFISDYQEALGRNSKHQSHATKVVMGLDQAKAVDQIMSGFHCSPEPSGDFVAGVRDQVVRGVEKLSKFGCIPKSYKQMGISPRISPIRYGDSINSTKKLVRNYGYRLAASVLKEYGFSIVDVDLRAAYTSVLLGLYPDELQRLRVILTHTNLWDSIQEDYRKEGLLSYYDKPSVKVCVYASLFGGGKKAMFDSILENTRKSAGMTDKEFKADDMFERTYQLASVTTDFMLRHPIVQDFNDLSKALLKSYKGYWLQGASGHKYQISELSFRHVFACFLQSFEFALLAGGTLELIKQYPQVEVIGHYHDVNVLAVPTSHLEEILKTLKEKVANLGKNMRLSFPIEMEVQQIFEPISVTL